MLPQCHVSETSLQCQFRQMIQLHACVNAYGARTPRVPNPNRFLHLRGTRWDMNSQDPCYNLMKSGLLHKDPINGSCYNLCIKPITGWWLNHPIGKKKHGFIFASLTKFQNSLKPPPRLVLILGYDITNGCKGIFCLLPKPNSDPCSCVHVKMDSFHAWWQLDTHLVQGLKK